MSASPGVRFSIIHEMTNQPNNLLNISMLCQIAGVSRSGYYNWLAAEPAREQKEQQDEEDFARVLEAYHFRGYAKGARSIHMRLLHQSPPVRMNIKKIRRLMHKFGLQCPIRKANPYRRMARAIKTSYVAPNLLNREFHQHGPRQILLTDITYIPYASGKRSYLSTILDAYTKQILAHVTSSSLEVDFVLQTVQDLVRNHGISLNTETLVNSDQGSHYTSHKFVRLLRDSGLRQSMSRRANCWDNAPQESLFGHMKDELDFSACDSHEEAAALIDDWVDYYNNDRYQWDLDKLAPNEYWHFICSGIHPLPAYPP